MTLPRGITELTVTKAKKFLEDKNGNRYMTKDGRPFARASVQFQETGAEWFGGFWSEALQEGSKVQAELYEEEYGGKTYLKFKVARKEDKADAKLETILDRLTGLQLDMQIIKSAVLAGSADAEGFEVPF